MEKVIEKIKTDRIKEINAKEAIDLLDKWRVQSVKSNAKDIENENAFEAKTDPFHPQNFSTWLSRQTGKKYDTLHSVASFLTTFAVLELANNFLELGNDSSLMSMDQVKEAIKITEKKLKADLGNHLKEAKGYLSSTINLIQHGDYEGAFNELTSSVIPKAKSAFDYAMKKKISIVEFEAAVEAAKILLFAKLLSISYDQEEKIFLPFRMIPMDKKRINNSDIEKILTDCIAHKNNVKMSFLSQSGPKQVQNILNTALKCVYPFLSELREFTSSWSKVLKDDEKITIKILPQFLPHGEENRTKIEIGVRIGDDDESPLTAHFWRNDDTVSYTSSCTSFGLEMPILLDAEQMLNVDIYFNYPKYLVLPYKGYLCGQYELVAGQNYYKQSDSGAEPSILRIEQRFLYQNENKGWYIGEGPGKKSNFKSTKKGSTFPLTGWEACGVGALLYGTKMPMTFKIGLMEPCEISINGTSTTSLDGNYVKTDNWSQGRPVYVNHHGEYLSVREWGWTVSGDSLIGMAKTEFDLPLCPAKVKKWEIAIGRERGALVVEKAEHVTVTCSKC